MLRSAAAEPPRVLADRPVCRRSVLLAGLGNYTHPHTRHSIGQCVLHPLLERAAAHDRALRSDLARRVARRGDAAHYEVPAPVRTSSPFEYVPAARGWLAHVSFLLDTAPPRGSAVWARGGVPLDAFAYALVDAVVYIPKLLMNVSGKGVHAAAALYPDVRVPQDVLLLHDEMARPFGKVSFKGGGSAGGHNGVRSVQSQLRARGERTGEPEVPRVRIGIGRPTDDREVTAWVLGEMPSGWLTACGLPAPGELASDSMSADAGRPGEVADKVWSEVLAWCTRGVEAPPAAEPPPAAGTPAAPGPQQP